MKKKKMRKLVIVVLVVIAMIIGILIFINRDESVHKLAQIYEHLNTNQTYLFEMEQNSDNKTIMAKKYDKTLIDQYSKDNHSTTIVKDNTTYLVLHDREEYYIYGQNNVEQNILTDGLKDVIAKPYSTGTEKIKGKRYSYEEYAGSTIFMFASTLDINEEDIKTRFFFDNDGKLAYIKTMTGTKQELLKVNLSQEVDDSIFEIPLNYAEN